MSESTATEEAASERPVTSVQSGRIRTVAAWTGVTAWGTWALLRWAGGDRVPGIDVIAAPVLALTPYAVAASPIPVLLAAGLRRWRAATAAGAVALALAAAVAPRAIGGGEPAAKGPVVRVLTANVYFGEADPARLADLVRRDRVDVLSIQELPPHAVERYESAGLSALLPHKVIDPRDGAAGSGLYSRHPLRALPELPDTQLAMPRAELTLPGGRTVEITAVHPVPPLAGRALRDWRHDLAVLPSASDGGTVRILAGDFNATFDHANFRRLVGRGYADAADRAGAGLKPTWGQAPRPLLTIDHVLVDERCAVRKVEVHDLPGSDHNAVLAEIRLP
ncbi:endonuclease/exonuclease/phosphatase family protein [Spirillospora sp. CA-294931]|uniref:endonuclease/exonuclease/phosphatase family protein n=1 Tax=Spirillospora sp. CA-294931 TaxID=3240042 RepID=UPI003D8AEF82